MLEPTVCALCKIDDCLPIAVGSDFHRGPADEAFLAVRCRRCGLIYLNPRPDASRPVRLPAYATGPDLPPVPAAWLDRLRRWRRGHRLMAWCRGLPAQACILDISPDDGGRVDWLRRHGPPTWTVQRVDPAVLGALDETPESAEGVAALAACRSSSVDLAIMIMSLETAPDPSVMLDRVMGLLKPGGRMVVLTDNTGSAGFSMFSNRHWSGYDFPRHLYLFDRRNLVALCEQAGFRTLAVRTRPSPLNWTFSMRNWVQDWHGPRWMLRVFSRQSLVALAVFAMIDVSFSSTGKGALLHGQFQKPTAIETP